MAAEAPNTGANGSASLAAMLEEQHSRHAPKPTVEDTVDEDDIQHPPPSSSEKDNKPAAPGVPSPVEPAARTPKPAAKKAPAFDVRSEELFPALGSGPKPKAPAAATWGAKPSAAAAVANGIPSSAQSGMLFPSVDATKADIQQLEDLGRPMFPGSCLSLESTWNSSD